MKKSQKAEEKVIGSGMTKKEAMKIRKQYMNREELAYLRRKRVFECVWPFFRFFVLLGLGFVIMYPIIFMVSHAFRDPGDMNDPTVMWLPRNYTLSVMKDTAQVMDYWETLKTTLFINIGCSLVSVLSCSITGYGFARFKFKGKGFLFAIVVLMILVPTQIVMMPQYEIFRFWFAPIVKAINGTERGLIDNALVMYLPALTANGIRAGLFILIFRQFFKGLPKELEDAAYLDGCGPLRTFVQIMVPNAASSFLTVFLFSVVWYWNDYYVSSVFFNNNQTIALMLKNLSTQLSQKLFATSTTPDVRQIIVWLEAGCLLSITPILVMYVCLQKYFTEGIERSGLVG